MKYTIEDLRNGKCAVKNDGTLEELKEVLSKAFPSDSMPAGNDDVYYYIGFGNEWGSDSNINLPTQSVKDFLSFSPKRGDKVLVRYSDDCDWEPRIFLTEIEGDIAPFYCVNVTSEQEFNSNEAFRSVGWQQMKPLEPQEMTLKQVCKELGREIKIVK